MKPNLDCPIGKGGKIEHLRVRWLRGLRLPVHPGQHESLMFSENASVDDVGDGRHRTTSPRDNGGGGRARGGGTQRYQQQQRRNRRPRPDRARPRQRPPPRPSAPLAQNTATSSPSSGGARHGRHRNQRGRNHTSSAADPSA